MGACSKKESELDDVLYECSAMLWLDRSVTMRKSQHECHYNQIQMTGKRSWTARVDSEEWHKDVEVAWVHEERQENYMLLLATDS